MFHIFFMKKTKINKNDFTLVELMVVIAIIAILAAIAVPAYSNYIMKARFQDEIGKMDNYRKAIAIYIQESGATSNEEFQSGLADVKDNYLGDANVAIMSEVKENNGRLLAHPVINGVTYQIALTPRINDSGTLINWECDIHNSAPPAGAMPRGCNPEEEDLNDDQEAYIQEFNDNLVDVRNTALTSASSILSEEWKDLKDALSTDAGTLGDLNSKIATANTLMQEEIDNIIAARVVLDDYFNVNANGFDTNYTNAFNALNDNDNGVSDLINGVPGSSDSLVTLQSNVDNYLTNNPEGSTDDQAYQDFRSDLTTRQSQIDTARAGQGLTELTAYRDTLDSSDSNSGYTAANTAVTNRTGNITDLTTAKTNYDNAQDERGVQSNLIYNSTTGYNAQITVREGVLHTQVKDAEIYNGVNYTDNLTAINQTYNDGLATLNDSPAFGQDHVEITDATVALNSTTQSDKLE
ncbi:MAG: prepilin-type N-terminal cleavage/methylation domain-containing protein [Francisella sp.]